MLRTSMLLTAVLGSSACATNAMPGPSAQAPSAPVAPAPLPSAHPEDLAFMNGMIHHHAQALLIAGWAVTHGASSAVQTFSQRVIVSQQDEIVLMQWWLRDHGEPVPEPAPRGVRMVMGGVEHDMLMPGMLSEEQLAQLDRARGVEFDRLFLTFMIQHHNGALEMVEKLFTSNGGAQDDFVFKFASDVFADQDTEIDRMQRMLSAIPTSPDP